MPEAQQSEGPRSDRRGEQTEGRELLARARLVTPAGAGGAAPLTRRRAAVAEFVARGLADQQIADGLGIVRRTAEGPAERGLGMLGFSNRSRIAARSPPGADPRPCSPPGHHTH